MESVTDSADFLAGVARAGTALRELFEPTPLQRNEYLSAKYGAEIWLKREDLTPVRSYKLRGASNAMRKALAADPGQRRFVCASAGNHAQGMAYACAHFGTEGVIFMPVTTPRQKIDKTRHFGGPAVEIRLIGDYFDDTLRAARDFCAEAGAMFLPPYDAADVIEGQATCALEILDQLPEGVTPDLLVMPVGGGGLAAGMTRVFAARAPGTRPRFVEPLGGPSLRRALEAGHLVTLEKVDNFVDGAAVARIGELNFETLGRFAAEDVAVVPEDRLCGTMVEMLNIEGVVLEPAGALAIDALRDLGDLAGKTVVAVVSGGNFDFERLPEVKERALRWEGKKKYFILRLPQRPGALREFLNLLGPEDDIARFEYLKKSARNFGSVLIGIESGSAAGADAVRARMDAAGFVYLDITDDAVITNLIV
ncbi:threonine ammonia-lyase IlvA [Amaricoccus solimangrovi]|uniref:L-threonine dehydratase n=1 Tax=Amaricoccus solimangrovi TaxID=2589815 RepID=A0A501WSK0_9RHOB|nr:threonine ammonia-lyase IlvA [Amaricoccus solimangrovi]TPE50257.1 threonine ammonia-lyase IlvA [Amaricoccus solimangrovi]